MPGQIEVFRNLIDRLGQLSAEVEGTADPAEKSAIWDRLDLARSEYRQWKRQTVREAKAGDPEARAALDAAAEYRW